MILSDLSKDIKMQIVLVLSFRVLLLSYNITASLLPRGVIIYALILVRD